MLEVNKSIKSQGMESKMILQIHDELVFEAPDGELETLKTLVKRGMEGVFILKSL